MTPPLSFNATNAEGALLCPVCGYPGYSTVPAYSGTSGLIGTTICPCCLWEPGFDDCPAASAEAEATILQSVLKHRRRWSATKQWQGKQYLKPCDFDGAAQLHALLQRAPNLA